MPTFKKGKGLKGKFNTNDSSNAVKDVMHHHTNLRKAGRRWNVSFCTLSRYVNTLSPRDVLIRPYFSFLYAEDV